jgi:hypothetical protein
MDETRRLEGLGDVLEAAARRDLGARRRPRRRAVTAVLAAAVLVPAAAYAGSRLISNEDVAKSLPAGTLSLAGTEPTCTTVEDGVEYHCVLAKAPAPEVSDWLDAAEPTLDATKHVNGGCRSLNSAGTEWECYLGTAAVDQQIIGPGFLGEYAPTPGVG